MAVRPFSLRQKGEGPGPKIMSQALNQDSAELAPHPQYMLCTRGPQKKWYAVAGVNLGPQSCLRAAEISFEESGFDVRAMSTKWGDLMVAQKNFGGYSADYKEVQPPKP